MVIFMHTTPLVFNVDRFDALCTAEPRGWTTDARRARELGVNQSTISRIRRGLQRPGLEFAHRCRRAFGDSAFNELFEDAS